ncbi:hypothetical protein F6X40_35595 [Paraburkholderia sp. UCT31]|uniref:hypothetical protein n=1 Tax=Paraburkholderia sp. UCT31 TaxID=2615209 RepID=UPI001656669B|nr:hypothetical protein [Paraburkholderia sp. UCT31]MBC8741875.1 hypothetical protein [Paraburkholderia sp. UCT31]
MDKYFFILGAPDFEMQAIRAVIASQKLWFSHAKIGGRDGRNVRSHNAYGADSYQGHILPNRKVVFVECDIQRMKADVVIDHHKPGDPGFGRPPSEYLEGSSLGQVLNLLEIEVTHEQRLIAAADHCLAHAYQGRCPGVDPEELLRWRMQAKADLQRIPLDTVLGQIAYAKKVLNSAPRVVINDEEVAVVDNLCPQLKEAGAQIGLPVMFKRFDQETQKVGIANASATAIQAWMQTCGLRNVYGDPTRGYAGGYL